MPTRDYTPILDNFHDVEKLFDIIKNDYRVTHEKLIKYTINNEADLRRRGGERKPFKDPITLFPKLAQDIIIHYYGSPNSPDLRKIKVQLMVKYYIYIYSKPL